MLLRNVRPDAEPTDREQGYLLLTVLVMVFLMLLALSVAAPRIAKQIQRDKEREAVERGLQYQRAIKLYYKKFGAYPSDIKQLENTNETRFLRKRYKDPITGKDDWRLIHMGEAKVPPLGFFGQPLQAGMSSASTGPGLGTGTSGTPGLYAPTGDADASGTNGSSNGSANGSSNGQTSGAANGGSSSFGFSNSGSSNGSSSGLGSSGTGSGGSGFGFSNNSAGSSNSGGIGGTPAGTGASSTSGSTTFGSAGPIVGVGIPVKKDSLLEYHKQKKYSDWEFVYDPQADLLMNAGGGITNGGNVNGAGSNNNPTGSGANGTNGSTGSFGSGSSGSSGFGNFGSSGSGSGTGSSGGLGSSPPTSPPQ